MEVWNRPAESCDGGEVWVWDVSPGLRWNVVVSIHSCVSYVGPVFRVSSAGEQESADGFAYGANGSFCNAVELTDVGGSKLAVDSVGVAELEEPG